MGVALLLLATSAALEAGGDALVRTGLLGAGRSTAGRAGLLLAGGLALFGYGVAVNLPAWDFGRLLGVYVALFFVVAHLINRFAFGVTPSPPVLLGGCLIVLGGCVVAFWRDGG